MATTKMSTTAGVTTLLDDVLTSAGISLQFGVSSTDIARALRSRMKGENPFYETFVSKTDWEAYGESIDEEITSSFGFVKTLGGLHIYGGTIKVSNCKGTVVMVHGYVDSYETNTPVIKMLLKKRYSVVVFDGRGHGATYSETSVTSGRIGEARLGVDPSLFIRDVIAVVRTRVKKDKDLKSKPIFLMGHSGGAAVALGVVLQPDFQNELNGMLLVSPVLGTSGFITQELATYLSLFPNVTKAPLLAPFWQIFGKDSWKYLEYIYSAGLAGRQRQWHPTTVLTTIFNTVQEIFETKGLIEEQTTPILFVQGSDDRIVNIPLVYRLFKELVEEDPTPGKYKLVIADGGAHNFIKWPKPPVFKEIVDWLDSKI